ncbi:MAG: hypothetical protein CMD98_07615, partial [Gammaproteobacteria bacterium]|nr:hypothetical protein [Gammaproteobacteria bacterium]
MKKNYNRFIGNRYYLSALFVTILLSFQLTYSLLASDKAPIFEEESITLPFKLKGTPCRISSIFDLQPSKNPYSFLVSLIDSDTGEVLKSCRYLNPEKRVSLKGKMLSFDFHNHAKIEAVCQLQVKIEKNHLDKIDTKEVTVLTVGHSSSFLFTQKDGT